MKEKIVYRLTVEDIQEVAEQTLGRMLTQDEILRVEDGIGERIGWFEAIEFAIIDKLNIKE